MLSLSRKKTISFSHCFWVRRQKLSTVPRERTVLVNEVSIFFTRPLTSAMACTPQNLTVFFLRLPDLCRLGRRTENGISLYESKLFCHLRLNKKLLGPSHLVKPRNLLDDFVDLVQLVFPPWWVTMMAAQAGLAKRHRTPETPEHTTWSTQGSTVLSHHAILFLSSLRNDGIKNNKKHNKNPGSRRSKHLFFISRKIILENHGSRLL